MVHIISFQLFFFFIFLIGRGFCNVVFTYFKKINSENYEIIDTPIYIFYPIFGLFFLGNLSVFLNFFMGINNAVVYSLILISIILSNLIKKLNLEFNLVNLFYFIITPAILSISSYTIGFARDAGGYHLNVQNWIRESNLHFGLYNLNPQYGFSSLIDYINSFFWFGENMILLHYVNLSIIVSFLGFLFFSVVQRNNSFNFSVGLLILIFGFLDNFGFSGGKNGFIEIDSIPKQDTFFAIVFLLASLFIFHELKEGVFDIKNVFFVSIFVLFSYQLRILGLTLGVLFVYYVYKVINKNKINNVIKNLIFFMLLNIFWFTKNVLITGCLIFPLRASCLSNIPWFNENMVINERASLANDWHKAYSMGDNIVEWFSSWSSNLINLTVAINFLITFLFLVLFSLIFKKRRQAKTTNEGVYIIFVISTVFIWLLSAPGIRLGLGIFMISITCISIFIEINKENKLFLSSFGKIGIISLFIIVNLLLPRFTNFTSFLTNVTYFNSLTVENVEYEEPISSDIYGVKPANKVSCWINIECSSYNTNPIKIDKKFYSYFQEK
tara:strand:+ start:161 stop:1822 length:1662 start_codon:yes stop_codon:yes gene_type:complete